MDLAEDVQRIEEEAKREARREMLALVASGKEEAVAELEKLREKWRGMKERRDKSLKAADERIERFKREEIRPAMAAARDCEEALQALYVEFVSIDLVRARDKADELLGHARLRRRQHEIAELETKRLLDLAVKRGKIDRTGKKEWKLKIKASAAQGKLLDKELEKLAKAALQAETELEKAREAARALPK